MHRTTTVVFAIGVLLGLVPFIIYLIDPEFYKEESRAKHQLYYEFLDKGELDTEKKVIAEINKIYQGHTEYRLTDGTRVDILTDDLAIEVDWAYKWYEAVGQSIHYSRRTGRKPAMVLIVKEPKDEKHITQAIDSLRDARYKGYSIAILVFRLYSDQK